MVHVVALLALFPHVALVAFLFAIQPLQGCGGGEPGNCPDGKVYKSYEACEADHECCYECVINVVENITTTKTDDGITKTTESVKGRARYYGRECPPDFSGDANG